MLGIAQRTDGTVFFLALRPGFDRTTIDESLASGKLMNFWVFEDIDDAYRFYRETFLR